jgi:hypothetical protein
MAYNGVLLIQTLMRFGDTGSVIDSCNWIMKLADRHIQLLILQKKELSFFGTPRCLMTDITYCSYFKETLATRSLHPFRCFHFLEASRNYKSAIVL